MIKLFVTFVYAALFDSLSASKIICVKEFKTSCVHCYGSVNCSLNHTTSMIVAVACSGVCAAYVLRDIQMYWDGLEMTCVVTFSLFSDVVVNYGLTFMPQDISYCTFLFK